MTSAKSSAFLADRTAHPMKHVAPLCALDTTSAIPNGALLFQFPAGAQGNGCTS
ncbi:MAG: hypothetical protein ACK4IS_09595 [Erythrobacter sp.]